ncbi:acetate--CoA ligase family protein [Arenibacterium halophilum]|uniref:Acetate--CoA ligase family protein n=1 Tax=Arenibacterium halophilum TaxID=2583821 RepID=A0ABY2X6N8_9RHOB|nr:acetate--CoA ligase family protein [Arenibacterium halophilum]TMV10812.1 acetate--CoA ligase family protein [Arenibacterium halophilum]
MTRDLSRLFNPRTIAVIGGGAWCASIIGAARRMGFSGDIIPVHPAGKVIAGLQSVPCVNAIPQPVDAAFIGVNRRSTVDTVKALAAGDAGGAVCFASGFSEAVREDAEGAGLQAQLVQAAGDMPILGPNCYGFVNALDRVAIWPDQHGMAPVERGVAILTQSSNIAINLTMQRRGLPIACMVTCGNMAQTTQAEIADFLLEDSRITAIGLHIEGFGDLRQWEALAARAAARGVAVVALKVGASSHAQAATVSHTASLAGNDAGAGALLERFGFARVGSLSDFLETLKLLHVNGRLAGNRIASISCSGGEASLIADLALSHDLKFPPLDPEQTDGLRAALGPMVALANPLDYNTYIWRDTAAMARAWGAMTGAAIDMTLSVVDYPHTDAADWACATDAALVVRAQTGRPFGVVASLPELMPSDTAQRLMQGGVVPFCGMEEALAAISAAQPNAPDPTPLLLPGPEREGKTLTEAEAKAALAAYGLPVPAARTADTAEAAGQVARGIGGKLALKSLGLAHKSDQGGVRLNLAPDAVEAAARDMPGQRFLVEEMVADGVAELLIGVTRDPAHGFLLTVGAGGVLTELLDDTASLLLPCTRAQVGEAIQRLRCAPLLAGYRGRPAAHVDAILDAADALHSYVIDHADTLCEVEINPLICTPTRAVAVDALIRKAP